MAEPPKAADPRQLATVNWGKSYSPARGKVEFIRIALDPMRARDFTVYLGDISQIEGIWTDRPYEFTFANGGTSSVQNIVASIRGSVVHVVASELVVRGDTVAGEDVPARAAYRYQAHCALGTPREHVYATGGSSTNAAGILTLGPLAPFSTHAWLDGLSGDLSNAEVTQINRSYGVDSAVTTPVAAGVYAEPRVLAADCNYLRLDVALPPGEVISWVLSQKILR